MYIAYHITIEGKLYSFRFTHHSRRIQSVRARVSELILRLLRRQEAEPLLADHTLLRELVVGRESRRVRALRDLASRRGFLFVGGASWQTEKPTAKTWSGEGGRELHERCNRRDE